MILDQYGKPVQRASISPFEATLEAAGRSVIESWHSSKAFREYIDSLESRVVDHRGQRVSVPTEPKPLGSTIQVRMPWRFNGRGKKFLYD